MWKEASRRATSLLLTLVLILGLLPAVTVPAFAAEVTGLSDAGIGLEADEDEIWSARGTTIEGSVTGTNKTACDPAKAGTSKLTITNNKGTAATLSFDYTLILSSGSAMIDGETVETNGSFSKELQPEDRVEVRITSKEGAYTTKINLANVFLLASGTFDVTFLPAEGGNYTVNDVAVSADGMTQNNESSFAYLLNATPAPGYKFLGWKNQDDTILSMDSAATLYFDQAATVAPWFIPADAAVFTVGKDYYTDFAAAITAAQSGGGVVVVAQSGTLAAGDYTIPSGVTLLVPFDAANTICTTEPAHTESSYSKPTLYRKLTLASEASITVANGGIISVGSKHTGAQNPGPGSNTGPYGQIQMEEGSAITLQSGGKLYAYGFVTGSGEVTALSGSEVWEYFQICGWRGGTASSGMQGDAERVFPFSQYYVQNIEVPLTIHAGAKEMLYTSIYSSWFTQPAEIEFVGQNGLFSISGEGGSFRKQYLPDRDRLQIDFNGDMTINEINVQGFGSGDYVLPINGNITINVLSGTASIDKDMSFLPGTVVSVAQGAEMLVTETGNLFFYDRDEWVGKTYVWLNRDFRPVNYSPTRSYTRTTNDMTDAKLDVNGTVRVAGGLYTSAGGADIISSNGSGTIVMQKTPDATKALYEATQSGTTITYQLISITPAVLKNSDGTYAATAGAEEGTTIAYEDGKWIVPDHVHSWSEWTTVTDATCTEQGSEKRVCSVCNKEETHATGALGHDYSVQQHDETHHWTKCSRCNATTEKAAHSGGTATCTAKATCAVCGAEYGELAAHTVVTDAAVPATCTTEGKTEGSHCSVCNTVIKAQETVSPLGHRWGNPAFAWAEDGSSCTVTFTCQNDTSHMEHPDVQISSVEKTPATCTSEGVTTYTAKVTFNGQEYTNSTDVADIERIAHSYSEDWQSDETNHWKECAVCHDKTQEAVHSITWVVDEEATEDETGLKHEECSVCGYKRSEGTVIDKLPHTHVGITHHDAVAATCHTTGNVEYWTCASDKCTGKYYGDEDCNILLDSIVTPVDPSNHDGATEVRNAVAATCDREGYTGDTYCLGCDKVIKQGETIDALGHSWGEWETVTAATCTEQGSEKRICSVCNEEETRATEALGHDFATEWSHVETSHWHACSRCDATTEKVAHSGGTATCTAKAICEVCGAEYGELAAHTAVTDAAVAPTCTTEGKTEGSHCSVCNTVIKAQETVSPLGHSWGNPAFVWAEDGSSCTVTFTCTRDSSHVEHPAAQISSVEKTPATCTTKGVTTYTAKVSFNAQEYTNSTDVADIEKIPHSYSEDWKSDADNHWKECAVCHDKTQEAAHTFTWVVDKAATEDETGLKHEKCTVCGCKRSEGTVIDKLPHTHVGITHHDAVAATCHTTGNVEYWTCASDKCAGKYYGDKDCNTLLDSIVTPVDPNNHDGATEVRNAVAATCDRAGYTGDTYCLGCDKVIKQGETIDALGHSWGNWETVEAATCTEQGSEKRVCSVCNEEETRATEVLGHDFGAEWSHDGTSHWHVCSRCDAIADEAAHSGGTATCTEKATCEVCGAAYGELAAHTVVTDAAIPATCTTEGKTEGSHCSVCGTVIEAQETVPALGHRWGQPDFAWAEDNSCTVTFTCQNDPSHTEQVTAEITSQVKTPATCTAKGVTTYTAKVTFNGQEYTNSKDVADIEMISHDYGDWQSNETNHWKECAVCQDKAQEAAHTFTWVVDKAATVGATGLKHEECTVCGYKRSEGTVIDKLPQPSGGGGTSSGSSGSSGSTTQVVTKPDGSSTTTVDNKDGSSSTTTVSKDGQVEAEVKLPSAVVTDAADKGEAVALPMPQVSVTSDKETAPTVTVDLPAGTTAKVEIPVADVTAGTVAVLVKADGTEEIVKTSVTTENGVALTVADGAKVRIVDNAIDFIDVKEGYWGEDEIDFVTSRELFNGTSETTFTPEGNMTRAMIVTVLARYDNADTTTGDTWYEAGAEWAIENGVSDGSNLDGTVSREQLVTMLWRLVGSPVVEGDMTAYPDGASVSDWAAQAMAWATDAGIITGNGAGALNPQGTATRVEVATMLARFVAKTN